MLGPSVIRTAVPLIVGILLALPVSKRLGLTSEEVTPAVAGALALAYYVIVRVLEIRRAKGWGWLLGQASAPVYPDSGPPGGGGRSDN
jgi:hypothetical protein